MKIIEIFIIKKLETKNESNEQSIKNTEIEETK